MIDPSSIRTTVFYPFLRKHAQCQQIKNETSTKQNVLMANPGNICLDLIEFLIFIFFYIK